MLEPTKLTTSDCNERFKTEEDCVQFIRQTRWPLGFVCPRYGQTIVNLVGAIAGQAVFRLVVPLWTLLLETSGLVVGLAFPSV